MNSFKNEGGLQYRFRRLTKAEYEAEVAGDSEDVIGLTNDQGDLRNRALTGEAKTTASTSDALADAFKRVSKGQTIKRKVEISEKKVNEPATAEATHTANATADGLAEAIRKARGIA